MKKQILALALLFVTYQTFAEQKTSLDSLIALLYTADSGVTPDWIVDQAINKSVTGVDVNSKSSDGKSLIELLGALSSQKRDMKRIKKVIMASGFDINGKNFKIGSANLTLLMMASIRQDEELLDALLKVPGINVNEKDANGRTALFYAKGSERTLKKSPAAIVAKLKAAGAVE